jgi:hypothetical protein
MAKSFFEDIFCKFDSTSKGYLTEEEYRPFAEELKSNMIDSSATLTMLETTLKTNGKLTLHEILSIANVGLNLRPVLFMAAPGAKIIELLKKIAAIEGISLEDKVKITWGMEQIMEGRVYETELGTPSPEELKRAHESENLLPEERRMRLVPWLDAPAGVTTRPEVVARAQSAVLPRFERARSVIAEDIVSDLERLAKEGKLEAFETANFNVWDIVEVVGQKKTLPILAYHALQMHDAFSLLDEEAFFEFINSVRHGYKESNQYHNDIHAADVTQMCHFVLTHGVLDVARLQPLDIVALLLSAIVHDFQHPGVNNMYLINTQNELAMLYNDQSVLENMHVSEAFKLIFKQPGCRIFNKLSTEEVKIIRKRMLQCVLSTDNAKHFELTSRLQNLMAGHDIKQGQNAEKIINTSTPATEHESKQFIMNACMHLADVSNPTRSFAGASEWGRRVTEEFYRQGDLEKQRHLPISFLCDRATGNLPSSQLGFIRGIARPYVEKMVEIFPKLAPLLDNVKKNELEWARLSEPASKPHA